jgi:1,2-phenylacetyl-CoA epoxidase PaaB subunit
VVKASQIVASQPEERGEFLTRRRAKSIAIRLSSVPDGMEHM